MAFDPKIKAYVRRHYVFDRLTLEQSADKAGVSFGTARRWKREAETNGDDWEKARDIQVMAGSEIEDISKGLLAGFIIQYRSTMDEVQNNKELTSGEKVQLLSSLSDSFSKMTASSKKLLPATSEIATAMKVIEMMANILKQKKAHLLSDFLDVLDDLEQKIQKEFK
ncbi:DUF1804 family protein [Pasteurella skyensis]|uniref:DUF1804 family protein n=1 Tax=Phocoenobacter skyensis TaxID=97481 RepID=A0AAJ6P357_9PAST|nr:DUF1804 family protein [Pasteurella skyensis]MDP8171537.1 DUF1804 family protein [Pasteurella skyensis]MDP8175439.1 DUF1804 family protein [Pasteurella skyensis]